MQSNRVTQSVDLELVNRLGGVSGAAVAHLLAIVGRVRDHERR